MTVLFLHSTYSKTFWQYSRSHGAEIRNTMDVSHLKEYGAR